MRPSTACVAGRFGCGAAAEPSGDRRRDGEPDAAAAEAACWATARLPRLQFRVSRREDQLPGCGAAGGRYVEGQWWQRPVPTACVPLLLGGPDARDLEAAAGALVRRPASDRLGVASATKIATA
jgi:hypothetical protein